MTREKAAQVLVDKTFQSLCFEMSSFSAEDVKKACLDLIEKEIARTEFITEIIGE